MENRKKLWIVSEIFYPEETGTSYILTKIAGKLIEKFDVKVICSNSSYRKNFSPDFQLNKNIEIIRVRSLFDSKSNYYLRLVNAVLISLKIILKSLFLIKRNEKVLIVTNPVFLVLFFSILFKFKKFELYILVHDVFPENSIPAKIVKSDKSLLYKLTKYLFDKAYSSCSCLIVLGRDMEDVINKKISRSKYKPEVVVIENWADTENITPIQNTINKGFVTLQYAGNIGRVQGLLNVLIALNNSNNQLIKFEIWGNGSNTDELRKFIDDNNLTAKVTLHNSFSRDEQNKILNDCDISLISLTSRMYGLGVPSKTYNILAAGKPLLYIGDSKSEISLLVKEKNLGYCFDSEDIVNLTSFFNKLSLSDLEKLKILGKNSRITAENEYSEEIILEKFFKLINGSGI